MTNHQQANKLHHRSLLGTVNCTHIIAEILQSAILLFWVQHGSDKNFKMPAKLTSNSSDKSTYSYNKHSTLAVNHWKKKDNHTDTECQTAAVSQHNRYWVIGESLH